MISWCSRPRRYTAERCDEIKRGRGGAEGAVRVCRAQEVAVTPEGRHGIPVQIKIAARLNLNTEGEGNK